MIKRIGETFFKTGLQTPDQPELVSHANTLMSGQTGPDDTVSEWPLSVHGKYVPGPRGWAVGGVVRRLWPARPKANNQIFRGRPI